MTELTKSEARLAEDLEFTEGEMASLKEMVAIQIDELVRYARPDISCLDEAVIITLPQNN